MLVTVPVAVLVPVVMLVGVGVGVGVGVASGLLLGGVGKPARAAAARAARPAVPGGATSDHAVSDSDGQEKPGTDAGGDEPSCREAIQLCQLCLQPRRSGDGDHRHQANDRAVA